MPIRLQVCPKDRKIALARRLGDAVGPPRAPDQDQDMRMSELRRKRRTQLQRGQKLIRHRQDQKGMRLRIFEISTAIRTRRTCITTANG